MQKQTGFKAVSLKVFFAFIGVSGILFSLYSQANSSASTFEEFLELHYQSRGTPPEIPEYKIITPEIEQIAKPGNTQENTTPVLRAEDALKYPEKGIAFEIHHVEDTESPPDFPNKRKERDLPADSVKYKGTIAIIIDDIGNHAELDRRVANLPGEVTLAVLPHTPFSKKIAELAHQNQKEIMLHAPMENEFDRPLGPGALTKDLNQNDFIEVLQASIESIPHISGVNNHMGSLLTQNREAMDWVMQTVEKNKLYFVDSRTTAESVANKVASKYNISHTSRNVFLDNEQTEEYVGKAFSKTLKISEKTGFALAIGHPYPATVDYLEKAIPELESQGFKLVKVSRYMAEKTEIFLARKQAD